MDKLKKFDILPKWWSVVVWILLFLLIFLVGCANTPNGAIDLSPKNPAGPRGYELKGFHGKIHKYIDDIGSIPLSDFPMSNRYLTQYCLNHYITECISLRITNINKEKKTYYIKKRETISIQLTYTRKSIFLKKK